MTVPMTALVPRTALSRSTASMRLPIWLPRAQMTAYSPKLESGEFSTSAAIQPLETRSGGDALGPKS
jgi:hypothetical protein